MIARLNRHPSPTELRRFGLVLLVGFGAIGGLLIRRGHAGAGTGLIAAALAVLALALVSPRLARPIYVAWMSLGLAIGAVTSRVLLVAIYLFLFTPLALLFRLIGRDALRRRKRPADTYWTDHPAIDRSNHDRLF